MINPFCRLSQVWTPMLLFCVQGFTQTGNFYYVGDASQFAVKPVQGVSYIWKVQENPDQNEEAEADGITFLSARCTPTVSIRWEKEGTFFVKVSGYNQVGCSNSKVFAALVKGEHFPEAVDDYATDDWLKSIRLNVLDNDRDAKGDLDPATLKVITSPKFGKISADRNGTLVYDPMVKHAAVDRFYYKICDACNQCDSAQVTIELSDPPLFLPEGFSPNGDGINDTFVIGGLAAYAKSILTVFSRDGMVVYHNDSYQNDWNGVPNQQGFNLRPLAPGTFYYLLIPGGTNRVIKGFLYIAK